MQELIFWMGVVVVVSTLLLILPFTRELFRPIYGEILKFIVFIVKEGMLWGWYFIKLIIKSHKDMIDHLFHKKSDYDADEMLKELKKRKRKERRGG